MKVLQINQSDISGGSAIAGYRLHQGLLNQGFSLNYWWEKSKLKTNWLNLFPVKES